MGRHRTGVNKNRIESQTKSTQLKKYRQGVWPNHVREIARDILNDVTAGPHRYRYAAALCESVYRSVDYTKTGSAVFRADVVLDRRQGDCEDQSTTLGSLLAARSFDLRFVVLQPQEATEGHVAVEVKFDTSDYLTLIEVADNYYDRHVSTLGFETEADEEGLWLHCDPTGSPVVGSINHEMCQIHGRGKIVWNDDVLTDYVYI